MHEVRYYLEQILRAMEGEEAFVPSYIVTVTQLPTGAKEVATNTSFIKEKIEYILSAYDEDMKLKTCPDVSILNLMIV